MNESTQDKHMNKLNQFFKLIHEESDRGCALICAALLDEMLQELLTKVLNNSKSTKLLFNGANGPLHSFYSKILISQSMGIIKNCDYEDYNKIRKIRNEFAHQLMDQTFESQNIKDICMSLTVRHAMEGDFKRGKEEFYSKPRDAYNNTTMALAIEIMQRIWQHEKIT